MSNLKKLAIVTSLVVIGLVVFMVAQTRKNPSKVFETKSNSQAEVTVEVTPQKLGVNEEENIFKVKLNTHSVDLDFDFEKIITLTDDLGNIYQTQSWEGKRGGHHLSGRIVFPKLKKGTRKVVLKILGVGGVEGSFAWRL